MPLLSHSIKLLDLLTRSEAYFAELAKKIDEVETVD